SRRGHAASPGLSALRLLPLAKPARREGGMSDVTSETAGPTFCPRQRRVYVLVAAILASSMGFIDGTVVSIATPAIRADLGASLADAQWVSNAYLLLLSSVLLLGGAAGDRFGVRNAFGFGIALFVAASMICSVGP